MSRRVLLALVAASMLLPLAPAAAQERFPNRPVRILVPYGPGGATDIAARVVAERLKHTLGQSVVVENKPGAFGILAIEEMLRAKPDGHTLMIGNPSTNTITPILYSKRISVDYEKSVVVVSRLVDLPSFLLATTREFAPASVGELVAHAKANPGKVRYGSAGTGSFPHYSMEVFAQQAGIDIVHVPNKGGGAAYLRDMMSGDIHIGTMNVATATPMLKNGTVRPLAITEESRLPEFPDIPSFKELGLKRPGSGFWQTLFAPAATPRPILDALYKAVVEALDAPDVMAAFDKNRMRRIPNASFDEAQAWMQQEMSSWRQVTRNVPIELSE